MIINFLGDSITQGAGANPDTKFVACLRKRFPNYEINNYGLGGTRIARQDFIYTPVGPIDDWQLAINNLDFNARALTMKRNADYVFVFGGTNDFGHGSAPLGDLNDTDVYTFAGALNTLFSKLINEYGKGHVFTILPLHRFDEDTPTEATKENKFNGQFSLSEYKEIMTKLAAKHGVGVLDFTNEFPKPNNNKNEGLFFDGLHPNEKGHALLAKLIGDVIENLK